MKLIHQQKKLNQERIKPQIIGGMFGLCPLFSKTNNKPPFIDEQSILLTNASSAIFLVIKSLNPNQVWLPSYLCDSLTKAVNKAQGNIVFYDVNSNLEITNWGWLEKIKNNDLVILINYFGLGINSSLVNAIKSKKGLILEDASQALLSQNIDQNSDFVIFSPRKFLGIPDGGILNCNYQLNFKQIELETPPRDWWLKSLSVTILRREFDIYGGERYWYKLFQETESDYPIGYYRMSELSQILLESSFNYQEIAEKRVKNYQILQENLGDIALFPQLSPEVIPLGFPIKVKNRDSLRQLLFSKEIYPPIHWLIQDCVPEKFTDSHRLSREIMTLPCDQRYNEDDMKKIANLIFNSL